jgi:hypothetical protein
VFGFDGKRNGHDTGELAMAMLKRDAPKQPEPPGDDAVEQYPAFAEAVRRRLVMGARTYKAEPASEKPLPMLLDEIATELEDLAGWGAILWLRVQALRAKAQAVKAFGERDEP